MKEQLMIVMTTVLSILTAGAWNTVLKDYLDKYFGASANSSLIAAIIVTIISVGIIALVVNYLSDAEKENVQEIKNKSNVKNYIREKLRRCA